jgi:thiamine biosynthesis lipoprotein
MLLLLSLVCCFTAGNTAVASETTPYATSSPPDSLRRFEYTHPQMGTVFRLIFYTEKDSMQAAGIARLVFDRVDALNASMSDYLPDSELNRLCATAGSGRPVAVSDDLWEVLRWSVEFSRKSEGAFDVSIGPLTRLWRRARNLKEAPDSARVEEARALTDYRNIELRHGKTVVLKKTGMRLDLGGIAQGYAADVCLKMLKQNGIRRALADAGGDIAIGEPPPGKKGWEIALPTPRDSLPPVTLQLARCGITTSGATWRYLEINGRRYSHIIDPRSGWGLTHRVMVTVQAPDAMSADAWATACSVMGQYGWSRLKVRPKRLKIRWLEY